MFPLLLIAAIAALALSQKKSAPAAPSGGGTVPPVGPEPAKPSGPVVVPSTPLPACELDAGIPPAVAAQVSMALANVDAVPAGQEGPAATGLEQLATEFEMSGFAKAAKCLRDAAQRLRMKAETRAVAMEPALTLTDVPASGQMSQKQGIDIQLRPLPKG